MSISPYLAKIMIRHGYSVERFLKEAGNDELEYADLTSAIAFEAADLVWAILATYGLEKVQDERYVRNKVAEAVKETLERGIEQGALQAEPWTDRK